MWSLHSKGLLEQMTIRNLTNKKVILMIYLNRLLMSHRTVSIKLYNENTWKAYLKHSIQAASRRIKEGRGHKLWNLSHLSK